MKYIKPQKQVAPQHKVSRGGLHKFTRGSELNNKIIQLYNNQSILRHNKGLDYQQWKLVTKVTFVVHNHRYKNTLTLSKRWYTEFSEHHWILFFDNKNFELWDDVRSKTEYIKINIIYKCIYIYLFLRILLEFEFKIRKYKILLFFSD
jgi:hypothetical protein